MYSGCTRCWTVVSSIFNWFVQYIWTWVQKTWTVCAEQECNWWCLCCNKWLCWIVLVIVAVVTVIVWLIVTIVFILVCAVFTILCLLCTTICWMGCFGKPSCISNCARSCGNTTVTTEVSAMTSDSAGHPASRTTSVAKSGSRGDAGMSVRYNFVRQSVVKVSSIEQLEDIVKWHRLFPEPVQLCFPHLDEGHCQVLQRSIDRYLVACGCREGKLGVLCASVIFIAHMVASSHAPTRSVHEWAVVGFTFVVFGALSGKICGLLRARILLRRSITDFIRSFPLL